MNHFLFPFSRSRRILYPSVMQDFRPTYWLFKGSRARPLIILSRFVSLLLCSFSETGKPEFYAVLKMWAPYAF